MPLNPIYRRAPDTPLATYDFADIVQGQGVLTMYLGSEQKTTVQDYIIRSKEFYSQSIEVSYDATAGQDLYATDYDYDITLGRPIILDGIATFSANVFVKELVALSAGQAYLTVNVYHYDGSTETSIGTATTKTVVWASGTKTEVVTSTIDITRKHFKIGDIIRVNVKLHIKSEGGTSRQGYGQDPKNREGDTLGSGETTIAEIQLPVKIMG